MASVIAGCQDPLVEHSASPVIELTAANFQSEVLDAEQPVLVEFWAPWCQPCVEMAPAMEQVAQEFSARAKVARLRIDDHKDLAASFAVEAPPAFIVFRGGQVVKRRSGKHTVDGLAQLIAASLPDGPQVDREP